MADGAGVDVTQDFFMAGMGLSLASASKVATAGDQHDEDNDGQD